MGKNAAVQIKCVLKKGALKILAPAQIIMTAEMTVAVIIVDVFLIKHQPVVLIIQSVQDWL